MGKLVKAQALINFYLLGIVNMLQRFSTLKKWLVYQRVLQSILARCSVAFLEVGAGNNTDNDRACRFFLTAHYGLYPMILAYLSQLHPGKDIVCLVGKQRSIEGLKRLAENSGVSVKFIEVGESFIFFRKCIRENKRGSVFISFIDVPLGVSNKNDVFLPFFGGSLRARNGLFKLAEKLSLDCRFILANFDAKSPKVDMESYSVISIEELFAHFERRLDVQPYLWDKVIDLHKFYDKEVGENTYLPFSLEDHYFAMNVASRKVLQVNKALFDQIRYLKNEARKGNDTSDFQEFIHAKANIRIEQTL